MADKKTVVLIGTWKSQREAHHTTKGFNSYDDALAFFWAMANVNRRLQVWVPAGFGSYESNKRLKGQAFPPRLAEAIKKIIAQNNAVRTVDATMDEVSTRCQPKEIVMETRDPMKRGGDNSAEGRAMELPDGKTCADCLHCMRCCMMFGHIPKDEVCDWHPSKFRPAKHSSQP